MSVSRSAVRRARRPGPGLPALALAALLAWPGAGVLAQGLEAPSPGGGPPKQAPPKSATPKGGAPGAAAPKAAAPQAAGESAAETVFVRRLSDVVAVRQGPHADERVLYYFAPEATLEQGDQVAQGSGGQSELVLPGGAHLSLFASAHVEVVRLSSEADLLRVPLLTQIDASVQDRPLLLDLPGDTQARLQATSMRIQVEPGRMTVRNNGGNPITLTGNLRVVREGGEPATQGSLIIDPGEEVRLPLFRVSGSELGTTAELWGLLTVRHRRGLGLLPDGENLRLLREPGTEDLTQVGSTPLPEAGVEALNVGGVSTLLVPGRRLVIRNTHHREAPPSVTSEPPVLDAVEGAALEPSDPGLRPLLPPEPAAPPPEKEHRP